MKIKVFRIPCNNDPNTGFTMDEEQSELQPLLEEAINEADHMKVIAQVAQYNQDQIGQSQKMDGSSFIFKKVISE